MRNIIVEELIQKPIEDQEIEVVERKGIGHPDSISDGIASRVSRALIELTWKNLMEYYTTILMKFRLQLENQLLNLVEGNNKAHGHSTHRKRYSRLMV